MSSDNEPSSRTGRAAPPPIDDFDRDEIIAAIREVFADGAERDRQTAIREVAHALGFRRTGNRIAAVIDSALIVAVKRGVVRNERGWLALDCRQIGDYPREVSLDALLGAMGRAWIERDEAMRAAARHLGFRRMGATIRQTFKSIIHGAIRRGLLEYAGTQIRRVPQG